MTTPPQPARRPTKPAAARARWGGQLPAERPESFPEREWQVLVALAGQTLQQVGTQLGVSRQLVGLIISQASERLGVVLWDGQWVSAAVWDLHQNLKWTFVARLPAEGGTISGTILRHWIAEHCPT